ncbi:hypothetical protein [Spirosoma sp. KUDC1026]|uniref:hypothetical protein n=1 Tax=Spirosoma sp. KUDC1026 TaxID=2745947 RepID=UPI00159BB074|nr:hypothetical protein [Spirosoma sp. KUDC1026]QKZ15326.1 hypothetical protein HU175_22960 [Spirosoma sp. KUDC1026]
MKKVLATLLTLISLSGFAQSPVAARLSSGFDLGMAYTKNRYNPSIAYYQLISLGESKVFSLGWTARLGAFYGDNIDFYTAPSRLTRGKSGLGALGAPLVSENIDNVRFDYMTATSLNFGIRGRINLGWVELGGSADLLGLTVGKRRTGLYRSANGRFNIDSTRTQPFSGSNAIQDGSPARGNLRLLGDNDQGSLSTEVFARFFVSQRVAIKAGYQWQTTEMRMVNRDVVANNNRFRNRTGMPYLAVTLPLFY